MLLELLANQPIMNVRAFVIISCVQGDCFVRQAIVVERRGGRALSLSCLSLCRLCLSTCELGDD